MVETPIESSDRLVNTRSIHVRLLLVHSVTICLAEIVLSSIDSRFKIQDSRFVYCAIMRPLGAEQIQDIYNDYDYD